MYEGILSRDMKERAASVTPPGPCTTRQLTPVECLQEGVDLGKAKVMTPDELTKEAAELILKSGYGPATIQTLYGYKGASGVYNKLIKWGLHTKGDKPRKRAAAAGKPRQNKRRVIDVKTFQEQVYGGGTSVGEDRPETPADAGNHDLGRYEKLGLAVGRLVENKQKAYGNMVGAAVPIMRVLYPAGISDEQIDDALLVVRIVDKLGRIARGNKRAFGESPYQDIAGYGLLGMEKDEDLKTAE